MYILNGDVFKGNFHGVSLSYSSISTQLSKCVYCTYQNVVHKILFIIEKLRILWLKERSVRPELIWPQVVDIFT